jgi:hypothetical protein
VIHIQSVYDVSGVDRSEFGIKSMANPLENPLDNRSERFVRVLTENEYGDLELQGYTDIQPDGSVIFEVPANTPYTFEVVNKYAKALNSDVMAGSEFPYDYLQRHPGKLSAAKDETQQCQGCHIPGLDYDHSSGAAKSVNLGALAASVAWPNSNPAILSESIGDTMAQALYQAIDKVGELTPNLSYQDHWTVLDANKNATIVTSYDQLTTDQPISVTCQQEITADCVARISYADHIKPIWKEGGRDQDGNSCVDCHDSRGFTKLDLSDVVMPSVDGKLASYIALFDTQRSYMFLSSEFSEVSQNHCRRTVLPPFLTEPENDCFSCFDQALMNNKGAIPSANFFDLFDNDSDDIHWLFNPAGYSDEVKALHSGMLNGSETKVIAEWIDMGATF